MSVISLKIKANDYRLLKEGTYIKGASNSGGSWFYRTDNPLIIVQRLIGCSYIHIAKSEEEIKDFLSKEEQRLTRLQGVKK